MSSDCTVRPSPVATKTCSPEAVSAAGGACVEPRFSQDEPASSLVWATPCGSTPTSSPASVHAITTRAGAPARTSKRCPPSVLAASLRAVVARMVSGSSGLTARSASAMSAFSTQSS